MGTYLRTVITCDATGKPALSWHFDQAAIDAEAAADGWYALLANLAPAQASPAEVFVRYKGQHVAERRYGEFKGPLAVTPLFLKTSRRIAALITVICLALLIFCLIERQVRKALAPHGGKMTGLPGYRLTPAAPTGRTIFMALSDLRLIPAHDGNPATIPKPPASKPGYSTSSKSTSAGPAGSRSEIPCAKTGSRPGRPGLEEVASGQHVHERHERDRPKIPQASLCVPLRSVRDARLIHMSTTAGVWMKHSSSSSSFFIMPHRGLARNRPGRGAPASNICVVLRYLGSAA